MGRAGDCVTCYSRQRTAIEEARAGGESYADLSRRFNLAEASVRRHFKRGHVLPRPAAAVAPKPTRPPAPRHPKAEDPDPEVAFAKVRQAAALLGVPLGELAACLENHLEVRVTTATEAEQAELFAAWDEADDCAEYVGSIVRNGKFLEETAT